MGVVRGILGTFAKGTVVVTSFGLGLALFARPWPDSPIWTKPRELVQHKSFKSNLSISEQCAKLQSYEHFKDSSVFQKYINDTSKNYVLFDMEKLIPAAHKYNQVSRGLLNLNDPIVLIDRKEGELVLFGKTANADIVGFDGKIHNGIVLTLLDESLCFCGFDKLPNKRGVTANLNVNFDGKLQPNSTFILTAKVEDARGRKVKINGDIKSLNGDAVADAKCLLVEPKWFKWLTWVDLF